jgi:hypothetical protein
MFRVKATLAISSVALACLILVSTAGSAYAGWLVSGAELKSSAALATANGVEAPVILSIPAVGVTVLCTGNTFGTLGAEIVGTNTLKARDLAFESCETVIPETGCALEETSENITTDPVLAVTTLGSKSPDARITFSAQTKKTLASIDFASANTCAFNSEEPLKGSVALDLPSGQTEEAAQALQGLGSVENNSLEVGTSKAYIEGCPVYIKLSSGSKWSYR